MLKITVMRGKSSGAVLVLEDFPVILGRESELGIDFDDDEVSREHLKIKNRGKLFIVEDLASKNGTFLNGDRVMNAVIRSGDLLLIGNTEFQLEIMSQFVSVANQSFDIHIIDDAEHAGEGVGGPVPLSEQGAQKDINIEPLKKTGDVNIFNKLSENFVGVRKIYHHQTSVLAQHNLEECSLALLRVLPKIAGHLAAGAVFVWSRQSNRLVPMGKAVYSTDESSFHFRVSRKALSECFYKKQGYRIRDRETDPQGNSVRYLLPIVHLSEVLGILHIETDHRKAQLSESAIHLIEDLLLRTAPALEVHLLRAETDAMMLGMVEAMIAAVEAKDTYTVGHSERVCKYSMAMAHVLKIPQETKKLLMVSSLCHDIGKIGIPDAILKKATLLSVEEYEEMRLHPTIGAGILANVPNAKKFISGVKYHHEKWDGTGYPEGLVGEEIPFFGRIVAVADVFDAMISGRSYSGFIEEGEAIEKIQKEAELFDPEILAALVKAWDEGLISQRTSTLHQSQEVPMEQRKSQMTKGENSFSEPPSKTSTYSNQVRPDTAEDEKS